MRVQRVVSQAGLGESWTLLGEDHLPVPPVESFLAHLSDQRRSPNTVRAYAFDLKDYFAYLASRGLDWARLRYDELAGFKPWLRLPPAARAGEIAVLSSVESACTESTINRKLAAVTSFYEFHARHGVAMASVIRDAARPVGTTRNSVRPFLTHVRRSRPMRSEAYVPISAATLNKIREQQASVREQHQAATAAYLRHPAPRKLPVDGLRLVPANLRNPALIVRARHSEEGVDDGGANCPFSREPILHAPHVKGCTSTLMGMCVTWHL